jgi:intraflagellar transport protein 122
LYITCGEYRKAIDLYGKNNHAEGLVDVCRLIDKSTNSENILECAKHLKVLKHYGGAKEAFLKLNDMKSLMDLNIDFEHWD